MIIDYTKQSVSTGGAMSWIGAVGRAGPHFRTAICRPRSSLGEAHESRQSGPTGGRAQSHVEHHYVLLGSEL